MVSLHSPYSIFGRLKRIKLVQYESKKQVNRDFTANLQPNKTPNMTINIFLYFCGLNTELLQNLCAF